MDPLHPKLKALKPDEPDEEIENDLAELRRARPGIKDEEILSMAEGLVKGGGQPPAPAGVQPAAPPPPPAEAPGPAAAQQPEPTAPLKARAVAPSGPTGPLDDDMGPEKLGGDDAAMAALQGLAGLGDVIGGAYGGQKTDFLKQAQGAEAGELAKRKVVSDELRARRGERRDERKLDIEALKSKMEAMKKAGKDTFEMEEKLRDGFAGQAKTFTTVRDQYGVLQAAAKDPSAAGDLALIFAYMKLVDPGSTVREGEFSNAQNSAGVPDRVRNLYNNALTGQRFDPKVRADFTQQADKLFGSHQQTFQANKQRYDALADAYGLQKDRVTGIVVGEAPTPPESAAAPAAGQPPKVTSQEAYDALPPGSEYIAPDGTRKRKK